MIFQVLTLFPERFQSYTEYGLPSRAVKKGLFQIRAASLREYADEGRAGRVDDAPYGGGPGMVLEVGPIDRALNAFPERFPVVLLTPRGERLTQTLVKELSALPGLTLVSGSFEGVDERVAEHLVDREISIGPFVLGSGDLAALCLIEAVTRLLPGYMGKMESAHEESDENSLEYPQYTRPADYRGWTVPDVLLSGNHEMVRLWRKEKSRERTLLRLDNGRNDKRNGN
ncbi:MAG: tRNA (guanosine(37)-N1)-methyltransferase TrmD [Spirochaetia bacterium]|nr:tRNA (guanosine(37)-N1)-methyltransferase TrmD [Spirochaetia bacterium]